MRSTLFSRPTLIAAVELLEQHTQARINQVVLRLGLESEISSSTGTSVAKKCDALGRIAVQRFEIVLNTVDGSMTLGEAIVREAAQLATPNPTAPSQSAFARGLARDGYVLDWGSGSAASIRAALPDEIQLPQTDDEVHQFLKSFAFSTSHSHLEQAIEAHTRGDWAACNSQLRTFLESLFDSIAEELHPGACNLPTSENRRALLENIKFLSASRSEWTQDGKNYINGLFKMLHTDGSHPGLSDEDHSTFRLHVVLVTARTFLRRFAGLRSQQV